MLGGNNYCVDPNNPIVVIFNRDLSFTVGSEICKLSVLSLLCQLKSKLVGERNRHRHKLGRFVTRIAEHHSLIACAVEIVFILLAAFKFKGSVNAHCDVR